jgi:ABC-type polysaccharide/polyol phosphate transport system ATPase subunit
MVCGLPSQFVFSLQSESGGLENVVLNGAILGLRKKIDAQFDEIIAFPWKPEQVDVICLVN